MPWFGFMQADRESLPASVVAAAVMSLLTILLQLWLLNFLVFDFPVHYLWIVYCLLIISGFVFAWFSRHFCRLIADHSTTVPRWLVLQLKTLSQKFNLAVPEVHVLNMPGLNAFALQGLSRRGHILLHTSVLTHLHQDEVEAVLAHEYSHLARHHAFMLTIVQGMTLPLTVPVALLAGVLYAFIYGLDKFRGVFLALLHVMTVLWFPLTSVGLALFTRGWEFAADRQAAQVIGTEKYIAVLTCLHGSFFQHPNLLSIAEPNARGTQQAWALSHPSLAQRINALLEIGQ